LLKKLSIPGFDLELGAYMSDEGVFSTAKNEPSMNMTAFCAFYEETSQPLFAYLLRTSGERALAEDLLQESYCRFLNAKFTPEDAFHKRNYLFRIATNLMRDHWRRAWVKHERPMDDAAPDLAGPAPDPTLGIEMSRALERLKPRDRQMLWLAYVEGSSHKEIAACMGTKAKSVRLLLFRARRKLAGLIRANAARRDAQVDV
jgi:RNA polymerase sigma-70 factor, ECF subfamily